MTTTFDFKGCRTRAEAVRRFRQYLEEIHEDALRMLATSFLQRPGDFDSPEDMADALEAARELMEEWKPGTVRDFADLLDREGIGPE